MRRQTKKTAGLYRKHGAERQQFLLDFPNCAFCGRYGNCAVHEILSGTGLRMQAFVSRACWLPACWDCNSNKATDRKLWPVERQLALKLQIDPFGFDLDEVNRIYASRLIDAADVLKAFTELLRAERLAA